MRTRKIELVGSGASRDGTREISVTRGCVRSSIQRVADAIETTVTTRHHRKGAALLRVGVGFVGLMYYLSNYSHRHFLWGPDGSYPVELVTDRTIGFVPSLYPILNSMIGFDILFHLGILIAASFMVGAGGRWLTAAHYLFLFSLYQRNPLIIDGGDNITYLVLLYLVAVDATAYFAVRRVSWWPQIVERFSPSVVTSSRTIRQVGNVFHNFGVLFIICQVIIVYSTSGMYKIQGQMWQDGTALYYIMRVPEFNRPGVSEYIYRNGTLIVLLTYATVLFQVLFVALLARRGTRGLAVLMAAIFHLGIAVFMGLTSFSLTVIAIDMIILDDDHYKRMALSYHGIRDSITARFQPAGDKPDVVTGTASDSISQA